MQEEDTTGMKRMLQASTGDNRVGGFPLVEKPTSHTTVRTVRYTAVQSY